MKYFKIPFEKWKYVCALDIADRGQLFTAIGEYTFNGKEPSDISPACLIAWMMFKEYIDYCKTQAEHGKKKGNVPEEPSNYPVDTFEQPSSNPRGSLEGASSNPKATLKQPSRLPQGSDKGNDENKVKNDDTLEAPSNSNNSYIHNTDIHNTDIQSTNDYSNTHEGGMGETKSAGTAMDELFAYEEQTDNPKTESAEKKSRTKKKDSLDAVLDDYGIDGELREAYKGFIKMRTNIKKPLTDRALTMIIDKVKQLSIDEATQIAIIDQSTEHCWQTVFALQDGKPRFGRVINSVDEVKKTFGDGKFHSVFDELPDGDEPKKAEAFEGEGEVK